MYEKTFEVRWDDVDALRHVRHTAYSTYAAQGRLSFFRDSGFTSMAEGQTAMSPILFTEQLAYRREIRLDDTIRVTVAMSELNPEASRWGMRHELFRGDGELAVTVAVTGAWIDLDLRKLATPPPAIAAAMWELERWDDFEVLPNRA